MSQTLHSALAGRLMHEISAGQYPPGSLLPSEAELSRQTGLARGTIRRALATLEREGVVDRRRGAGTRVLGQAPRGGFGQTVSGIDELIQYAQDTRRIVRSVEHAVLDRAQARALGVEAGSRWVHMQNTRVDPAHPSRPVCSVDNFIRSELGAATSLLGEETMALCQLVERVSGVRTAAIEQELQASVVTPELAGTLKAAAGSPALRIVRRYLDPSGWLFQISVSLHPADRFAYRMRLQRSA